MFIYTVVLLRLGLSICLSLNLAKTTRTINLKRCKKLADEDGPTTTEGQCPYVLVGMDVYARGRDKLMSCFAIDS